MPEIAASCELALGSVNGTDAIYTDPRVFKHITVLEQHVLVAITAGPLAIPRFSSVQAESPADSRVAEQC